MNHLFEQFRQHIPGAGARFLELVGADDATIARARGAAINQACAALPYYLDTYPLIVVASSPTLQATIWLEVHTDSSSPFQAAIVACGSIIECDSCAVV